MKFKHYDWMLQVTWQVTTNQSVLEYDLALKIQWYQNPAQNLSKNVRKRGLESKNHFRLRRTRTEAFWRQGARANHRAAVPSCQEVLLRLKSKHLCICLSLSLSRALVQPKIVLQKMLQRRRFREEKNGCLNVHRDEAGRQSDSKRQIRDIW